VFFPQGIYVTETTDEVGQRHYHLEAQVAEPFNSYQKALTTTDQGACGINPEAAKQGERLNCSPKVRI